MNNNSNVVHDWYTKVNRSVRNLLASVRRHGKTIAYTMDLMSRICFPLIFTICASMYFQYYTNYTTLTTGCIDYEDSLKNIMNDEGGASKVHM